MSMHCFIIVALCNTHSIMPLNLYACPIPYQCYDVGFWRRPNFIFQTKCNPCNQNHPL